MFTPFYRLFLGQIFSSVSLVQTFRPSVIVSLGRLGSDQKLKGGLALQGVMKTEKIIASIYRLFEVVIKESFDEFQLLVTESDVFPGSSFTVYLDGKKDGSLTKEQIEVYYSKKFNSLTWVYKDGRSSVTSFY